TGSLLWADRVDNGFLVDDAAWAVTIADTRVFVAGTSSTPDGDKRVFLRAYDATSGGLLWEAPLSVMSSPQSLTLLDGTLFVHGPDYEVAVEGASGNLLEEEHHLKNAGLVCGQDASLALEERRADFSRRARARTGRESRISQLRLSR